ncbi:MAG: glycoside hydrolase family 25 domain-containing protein, partial [Acidimicrobiales bacterium]
VVGISRVPGGAGYWLVGADGGVFTYGDAPYRGSVGGIPMLHAVKSIEEGPGYGTGIVASANEGLGPYTSGSTGYDISWPQCGGPYPGAHQVGIVGVNNGHAGSTNSCLGDEVAWAGPAHSLYMNLNSPPGSQSPYDYGYNAAAYSVAAATAAGAVAQQWWLDVETGNYWSGDTAANTQVIQGAVAGLRHAGLSVGVYSTPYQWYEITGGAQLGLPVWVATGTGLANPSSWCSAGHAFNGGSVWMVQYGLNGFDGDYAC